MVTPELLEYVRGEITKGKTREEIHKILIAEGGWNEEDLSGVFRTVIPMQNIVLPNLTLQKEKEELKPTMPYSSPSLPSSPPSSSLKKFLVILIIWGGFGFGAWYYRSAITSFLNFSVSNLKEMQLSFSNKKKEITPKAPEAPVENDNNIVTSTPIVQTIAPTIDCGTMNTSLKLGVPSTYENSSVLSCLGQRAVSCENAKGIIKDDLFPTIFEIIKVQDSCNFKLSYGVDSSLSDITGEKLAGQYISCPLSIVKEIDNSKPTAPRFIVPDKTNLSEYGGQIYFYGTLGLFVENNLDKNKIQNLGCNGPYVDSVLNSYQKMQTKE